MAITGVSNYNSVYENTYAASRKETTKKEETQETLAAPKIAVTAKKSSNEEYLKTLQKQVPYLKLQTGYGVNMTKDNKDVVDINPKLLEKMQNDPKAAEEYTQRLKDVENAHKFVDNYFAATGYKVVCRHAYIDENGNYSNFSIVERKDELNEKLRKEAQENTEELIEKSREKSREKTEQLAEKLEEKAEEAKESEKSEEKKASKEDETATNKAEQLLGEKIASSKDDTIYLNDTDLKTIIEAAKEDNANKSDTGIGDALDLKV